MGVIMSTVVGVTVYQSTRPANSLAMRGARDGVEAQVLSEKSEYLISLGAGGEGSDCWRGLGGGFWAFWEGEGGTSKADGSEV